MNRYSRQTVAFLQERISLEWVITPDPEKGISYQILRDFGCARVRINVYQYGSSRFWHTRVEPLPSSPLYNPPKFVPFDFKLSGQVAYTGHGWPNHFNEDLLRTIEQVEIQVSSLVATLRIKEAWNAHLEANPIPDGIIRMEGFGFCTLALPTGMGAPKTIGWLDVRKGDPRPPNQLFNKPVPFKVQVVSQLWEMNSSCADHLRAYAQGVLYLAGLQQIANDIIGTTTN